MLYPFTNKLPNWWENTNTCFPTWVWQARLMSERTTSGLCRTFWWHFCQAARQKWKRASRICYSAKLTDFFPPGDETFKETKVCKALAKCLSPDGNFTASTWWVRDSFLGSSLVVASLPSSSPAFSDAIKIVPHDVGCTVLCKLLPSCLSPRVMHVEMCGLQLLLLLSLCLSFSLFLWRSYWTRIPTEF